MTNGKSIKVLILDVDGTLTDGQIYMGTNGEVMKSFNVKDGYALHEILPNAAVDWSDYNSGHRDVSLRGIIPIIITGRESEILNNRCKELGIVQVYQGCEDKCVQLTSVAQSMGLIKNQDFVYENVAYIGDDLNDLPAMRMCGLIGCPKDAAEQVKEYASYVCNQNGGHGAVREFIEWMISIN